MTNENHVALVKQGMDAWNEWRRANPNVTPDLSWTDLAGADLRGAELFVTNLRGAVLERANLRGADLYEADLIDANLRGAALGGANLRCANFGRANLSSADLSGADLRKANLRGANLRGVDLRDADLSEVTVFRTIFADSDLSTAKGMETVVHTGPSTIGIDTLFRSSGNIPEVFLRGAGVPEDFINPDPIAYCRHSTYPVPLMLH